jgi:hypothetical protein
LNRRHPQGVIIRESGSSSIPDCGVFRIEKLRRAEAQSVLIESKPVPCFFVWTRFLHANLRARTPDA